MKPGATFFFFQAEDGIRATSVTGVQTCALPIWGPPPAVVPRRAGAHVGAPGGHADEEIGRASCRESVVDWGLEGVVINTRKRGLEVREDVQCRGQRHEVVATSINHPQRTDSGVL